MRKLLDMLNSRSISVRQAKHSFETVLTNWPDFELSETGWYRLLDGSIRWRFHRYAVRIFEVMTDQGVVCPSYLMTSMLQLVSMSGMHEDALRLFDSAVAAGFEPSVHNFSPLLKSCGTAQKARELLQRMEFVGIQANVISYTAAIKSCENTGDWRSALELLDLMRAASVTPNEITYCCVINVASRGLAGDVAVNVLREMLDLQFPPNLLCYGSALTACAKVGMWKEVETLLTEMEQHGLPLQESVIISVINSCRGLPAGAEKDRPDVFSSYSPSSSSPSSSSFSVPAVGAAAASIDMSDDEYAFPASSMANVNTIAMTAEADELRAKASVCQWPRAQWIIEKYGLKVANVTESMYTMAMDVCQGVKRYREVLSLFHLMLAQHVMPSKSSFSFALRACAALSDGDEAVRCIRAAERHNAATSFMYNSTLVLLDTMKRSDLVVVVFRDLMAASQDPEVADDPPRNIHYSAHPSASMQSSRVRLPPPWMTRRVLNNALMDLTDNFATYFTEIKNGRLAPSKAVQPFVKDVTELLRDTVHDKYVFLVPNAYAMANKLVLDSGDADTLRCLLNQTLYRPDVNSTRLYDFALKVLARDHPDKVSLDTILGLVTDVRRAGYDEYASWLLMEAIHRLRNCRLQGTQARDILAMVRSTPRPEGEDGEDASRRDRSEDNPESAASQRMSTAAARDISIADRARAALIYYLLEYGRRAFMEESTRTVSKSFPRKAYNVAAWACKRADDPRLMLSVYRLALEDGADDKMLRNIIIHTLARSIDHWDTAIEILEDMPKPDMYMYNSALIACNTGRDWEQAIYILDKMQANGMQLSTVVVTSAIAACSTCGQADAALRLLDMMEQQGIPRNVWTYNAVMSACAKSGRWKDALAVFEKMRDVSRPGDLKGDMKGDLKGDLTGDLNGRLPEAIQTTAYEGEGSVGDEGDEEGEDEEGSESAVNRGTEVDLDGWDGNPPQGEGVRAEAAAGESVETDEDDDDDDDDDAEGEGLFRSMRGIANRVTFNTLIEALGQGGQAVLVDELYKEAVDSGAVGPLRSFDQKGLVDLHGHSAHMAVAAIRYTFEYILQKDAEGRDHEGRRRRIKELTVIVGKGGKLASVIQRELTDDFRPPVRSYVSKTNSGRLLLSEKDIVAWLNYHRRT